MIVSSFTGGGAPVIIFSITYISDRIYASPTSAMTRKRNPLPFVWLVTVTVAVAVPPLVVESAVSLTRAYF